MPKAAPRNRKGGARKTRPAAGEGGKRYGEQKEFQGRRYHGMKVGGIHRWAYPDGEWTEQKAEPDRWTVTFTSLKRRQRRAPDGSGAETGSGYHWFITAHQWVEKLDANTYATHLEGSKYLVAFRKPDWPVWNTQFRNAKRRAKERTIAALKDAIRRIEAGDLDLEDPQEQDALAELVAQNAELAFEAESEAKTRAPEEALSDRRSGNDGGPRKGGVRPQRRGLLRRSHRREAPPAETR